MLAFVDVANLAAPEVLALQWGVGPLVSLMPSLTLALVGLLAIVAPVLAQEPGNPPAAAEPASATEPVSGESAPQEDAASPSPELQTIPVAVTEPEGQGEPDGTRFDDIQVTASKRFKAQRDLPGSVGAIRGQDLERIRAQGMEDYLKLVPGVALADYGTGEQIPVIRGIASSLSQLGAQFTSLTTGIYLDDMPFSDLYLPLSVPDLNPFDLERVEVLKGPQGTLFGSGALAGAIRYIVQKPNLGVWQGKVAATVSQTQLSSDLSRVGAGALNAPLFGDSAAVRVVGVWREDAGFYDAVPDGDNTRSEEDVNRLDQWTGRALVRWEPRDDLSVSGLYFVQETDRYDQGASGDQAEVPERRDTPFRSPSFNNFGGGNLGVTYDLSWARLLYSGNTLSKEPFYRQHQENAVGLGNQEDQAWYNQFRTWVDGYTHELRLASPEGGDTGGWEWLVGVAVMQYDTEMFQFIPNPGPADSGYYANPPEEPEDVPPAERSSSFLWANVFYDGTEQALFGEAMRRFGEHWEVTLGARQFETELVADATLAGAQIGALFPGETERRDHYVSSESGLNPKFSVRYLHDRNIQAYALAAKGFQFGGFQINPPALNFQQAASDAGFTFGPYNSSKLWNYELGLRTEWLDRRVRFDVAAFYLDWTDLQLTIQVPVNPAPLPVPPGSGLPEDVTFNMIANVGAAHSEGLEASLEVLPFAGAKFSSAAAWISALTDVPFDESHPDGAVPPGSRLPGTPRFQWVNQFTYEHALPYFTSWHGGLGLTHVHIGESPDDVRVVRMVGGYDTLDAQLTLARSGIAWLPEISLGVNNITDVRAVAAYAGTGSPPESYYFLRPRTSLLTLAWSY